MEFTDNRKIESLYFAHEIDASAFVFCKAHNLVTVYDLKNYFLSDMDLIFKNKKKDLEAIRIFLFVLKESKISDEFKKEPILRILKYENISSRSQNICNELNFGSLYDILSYFKDNSGFLRVKNCGIITGIELSKMSFKYLVFPDNINNVLDKQKNNIQFNREYFGILKYLDLKLVKIEILNALNLYLRSRLKVLPNRIKNVFKNKNNEPYDIFVYQKEFINDKYKMLRSKNIGRVSVAKFNKINHELDYYYCNLTDPAIPKALADFRQLELINSSIFSFRSKPDENIYEGFKQNNFALFKLIDNLIPSYFSSIEVCILKNFLGFDFYLDCKQENLALIAKKNNLTRERVRQLSLKILDKLENFLQIFKFVLPYSNFKIDSEDYFMFLDSKIFNEINERENVNFTFKFYNLFFKVCFEAEYINFIYMVKRYSVKIYFVKKIYAEKFNYEKFNKDLIVKLNGKIKGIQDIEINRYIAKYYLNTDIAEKKHIRSICVAVIKDIFGLIIIEDKYIRLKNADFMKIEDHAYIILEEANRPMTLLEISEKFRESGLNQDFDSLRIALRNKKKFYAVKTDWNKRFNLYNLVKWKKIKKNSAGS